MRAMKKVSGYLSEIEGYSLIETAIVLVIGGILLASVASALNLYIQTQRPLTTQNNMSVVVSALQTYLIQTGAYPCPASMSQARGTPSTATVPGYGYPQICDPTNPNYIIIGSGGCNSGMCESTSDRKLCSNPPACTIQPGPALTAPQALVRQGMIPFRALGLQESYSVDGWNNRISYIVTEDLAVPATYNRTLGAIDVLDQNNHSLALASNISIPNQAPFATALGSIQFVLISYGPDGVGATSRYGGSNIPCAAPGSTLDALNCTANATAYARYAPYAPAPGQYHFDDTVLFYSSTETPLWKVADASGFNIADIVNAGNAVGAGKIGINIPSPATAVGNAALQVNGIVHASSNLNALALCQEGSQAGCLNLDNFQPYNAVTAPNGTFGCPAGQYATGVANNAITCSTAMSANCPAGQIMQGINTDGTLNCGSVVGCPATSKPFCNPDPTPPYGTQIIPAAIQGTTWTSVVDGISYQKTYQCGSNGQWQHVSTTGVCTCTVGTTTTTVPCQGYNGAPVNGLGFWTGNVTTQTTTALVGGVCNTTSTITSNTCTCIPGTQTSTGSCPSGDTGSTTLSTPWTCSSSTAGSFGATTQTGSTCTCNAGAIQTTNPPCPVGYTGSITMTSTESCPGGVPTWSTPIQTQDTCTCTGATNYQSIGCPAPEVGSILQDQTFNCTTNTFGPWVTYQNNCGVTTYSWQPVSTQSGPNGAPLPTSMNSSCTAAQVGTQTQCSSPDGSQYWYQTCQCN